VTLKAETVRLWLMGLIIVGAGSAFAMLWIVSSGGAISPVNLQKTMGHLVRFYIGPVAILCGFYFPVGHFEGRPEMPVPFQAFVLGVILVGLTAFGPFGLMLFVNNIEEIQQLLGRANPYTQFVSSSALAYFFLRN
jgi:hypothetical protein